MMRRALLASALALPLAAALAGCWGSLDDPSRFTGHLGDACPDVPTVLGSTCTMAGCHTATMPSVGLDLASADIVGRLSGKKASGGPGLLVDPADPSASVLYLKLTASPPFGARMPLAQTPLDDATVACVLTWLEASGDGGAP